MDAVPATLPPQVEIRPMQVIEARCEHELDPLGIDAEHPRFAWILGASRRGCRQSAYRIMVASSVERLRAGIADKWDSGKTDSSNSVQVDYAGAPLISAERCWWRVQAWDEAGTATPWSEPSWFEMGLLHESDWRGCWIGDARTAKAALSTDGMYPECTDLPAPLLRREFRLDGEVASARLYISGVGWYEARINGRRVGDRVLDPLTTDYPKRVFYAVYDVASLLVRGQNALGVMLGNGWYCPAYGDSPRLRCQLAVRFREGGTLVIASDEAWRCGDGPIQANSITTGEAYDARREVPGWDRSGFNDAGWRPATRKSAPGGVAEAQLLAPIRVRETLAARALSRPAPMAQVIDFGTLFAGWARLRLRGPAGTRVTITYATRLQPDGRVLALEHGRGQDTYILRGDAAGEVYEPRFTFHAVRFVQVDGQVEPLSPKDAVGAAAYNDVELPRGFACANERLNRIHALVRRTLTNELYGIQMDCINSEHWGWLEPGSNPGTLYPRAWMPAFWEKFLDDARAAQHDDGVIPDVVPAYPIKARATGDPSWAGNFPLVVWYSYRYFEDRRILERNYQAMVAWVERLGAKAANGIVTEGYYGDHMLPGPAPGKEEWMSTQTPPPLLRTAFYFADAHVIALAAEALGRTADAAKYTALAASIRRAYNAAWYDPDAKRYAGGSQTANLLSVALGLAPDGDCDAVVADIARDIALHGGHHHTGNIGTTALMEVLVKHGRGELMYDLVDRDDYPGWGYMVAQGSTTIWESWGAASIQDDRQSMAMFTTIDHFFWNDLAGIRGPDYFSVNPSPAAFANIVINPFVPARLAWAEGEHRTPRGDVRSRWERIPDGLALEVEIPVNATGTIRMPTLGGARPSVREGGTVVWDGAFRAGVPGIAAASVTADAVQIEVGSGRYRFELHARAGR